jgi:hypothetical protein
MPRFFIQGKFDANNKIQDTKLQKKTSPYHMHKKHNSFIISNR